MPTFPTGMSRAIGRPRSVTWIVAPLSTSRRYRDACCLISRIPMLRMCYLYLICAALTRWPGSLI